MSVISPTLSSLAGFVSRYCAKGYYAKRSEYEDGSMDDGSTISLKCYPAAPGEFVEWAGTAGGVKWMEDVQKCVDLKSNSIAAKTKSTGCTVCEPNTYANSEPDADGRSNYVCEPCGTRPSSYRSVIC